MAQRTALLLISGGIDSPVAGKLVQEKGYTLKALHFSQVPFTENTPETKSLALCSLLGIPELMVVDAGEMLKHIADTTYREYYFVLMKRFFMKVGETIAKKNNCEFLVTGESIGQVSSQTMSNLNNINNSVAIEIVRPLLFMNKQEIIDRSIKENYFEVSKGPEMCDALMSGKPKTHTKLSKILIEEQKCGMDALVTTALTKMRIEKVPARVQVTSAARK